MQLPCANRQASNDAGGSVVVRVAALADPAGGFGSATPMLEVAGFVVTPAGSLNELCQLVGNGTVDAVVADPELGGGWPADVAARLVGELRAAAPLVLVCRAFDDARLLETRLAGPGVSIVQHERLTAELLASAVTGAIATHRARPRALG